nr:hypothetical protein [Tanacetum cinerariifolium]
PKRLKADNTIRVNRCNHTNKSHVSQNVNADLPGKRQPRSPPEMLLPQRCRACSPWRVLSQGNRPPSHPRMGHREQVAMVSQLRLRFKQEVRLLKKARAKIATRDQRIQAKEEEVKRLDQEIKSLRVVEVQLHDLHNQTKNLETLVEAEVDKKKVKNTIIFESHKNL